MTRHNRFGIEAQLQDDQVYRRHCQRKGGGQTTGRTALLSVAVAVPADVSLQDNRSLKHLLRAGNPMGKAEERQGNDQRPSHEKI